MSTSFSHLPPADLTACIATHLRQNQSRISAFEFAGQTYWVKQLETLTLRLRLQKGNPTHAFQAERDALHFLEAQNAPAPRILAEGARYFVLPDCGLSLHAILHGQQFSAEKRQTIFTAAGKALADWHRLGLAHGRPAIKDMCWQDQLITLLDFERFDANKCTQRRQAQDIVIFVQSLFSPTGHPSPEAEAAINAYQKHDQLDLWPRAKRISARLHWLDIATKPLQRRTSKGAREFKAIPLTLNAFKTR